MDSTRYEFNIACCLIFSRFNDILSVSICVTLEMKMLRSLMFCFISDVIQQQTVWLFIKDLFVGLGLMVLLGPPVIAAIIIIVQVCWPSTKIFGFLFYYYFRIIMTIYCFQKSGPYLAIYLWAFILLLSVMLMAIYPVLIAPLFNKFTPVCLNKYVLCHEYADEIWFILCKSLGLESMLRQIMAERPLLF